MPKLTPQQLSNNLKAVEPLELGAVSLLQTLRSQTGEWFPTNLTPHTAGTLFRLGGK